MPTLAQARRALSIDAREALAYMLHTYGSHTPFQPSALPSFAFDHVSVLLAAEYIYETAFGDLCVSRFGYEATNRFVRQRH